MAVTKILDIDGVKTLWDKIKGMFATKSDLNNYIPKYGGGNDIQVNQIHGGISKGVSPNTEGDQGLFIGNCYGQDYKNFQGRTYGIVIPSGAHSDLCIIDTVGGVRTYGNGTTTSSSSSNVINGSDIHILLKPGVIKSGDFTEDSPEAGICISSSVASFKSNDTLLFMNQLTGSRKSHIVTKTGFAMGMTTADLTFGSDANPGGNSSTCAFYFDKSKTLIGCSDTAATRNVVEIQKGTVRMRANGTSLLKASTDTSYARLASKTGCVAAYQNLYVVNPDNNVAGLKVETDTNGNVITTIGDKTQNTEDVLRIEYGGHTYSLDLVRLEDDGYLTQID